jgi:hypothetical protein
MDLKALIAKMDQIESKKFLTEDEDRKPSKKQEREVELPSGAKVKATKVQGWQSQKADKEADKESKRKDEGIVFNSAIGKALLREFGLTEEEFKFSPEQEKWLGGANRQDPIILSRMPGPKPPVTYFKDPADQAKAKEMNFGQSNLNALKGLVGMKKGAEQAFADPTTAKPAAPAAPAAAAGAAAGGAAAAAPAPNAAAVAGVTTKPQIPAAAPGGQAASPAAAPGGQAASLAKPGPSTQDMGDGSKLTTDPKTGATAATNDDGTPYIPGSNPNLPKNQTKTQDMGDGSKLTTGPGGVAATNDDGTPYIPGSNPNLPQNKPAAAAPAAPGAATGVNAQGQNVTMPDGTNPETGEKTTTTAGTPAAAPAGGQAASPAAPPKGQSDPKVKALQDKLIAAGAKIKADGIMGPQTQAAMKQFPQAVSGNLPLPQGTTPSTAGAGRGGQGGPTAAQLAAARTGSGGQAASPSAGGAAPAAGGAGAVPATADKKKPYWVNGTRYEFKGRAGWQATAAPTDKLQWNSTRARSMAKFTGADDEFKPGAGSQAASPAAAPVQKEENAMEAAMLNRIRQLAGL